MNQSKGQTRASRVLIDASNLKVGGGVQVAASLIDEILRFRRDPAMLREHAWLGDIQFDISPQVADNLTVRDADPAPIVTQHRWWSPRAWLAPAQRIHELQLTVFGPRYGRHRAPITVTGIADVTSIYPWPEGVPAGPLAVRLKRALRGRVSRRIFQRESFLVSESQSLLDHFVRRTGYDPSRTMVIPNAVNSAVADPGLQQPLAVDLRAGIATETVLLAYVARLYPHKNHAFLPLLQRELESWGVSARFVVTLTDEEWEQASDELRSVCINAGIVPVATIADLNRQCDAVVFPSLLESFSATPLEAMIANGLLFASDRPFVRDVCGDAAVYFDPLDARSSARIISDVLASEETKRMYRAAAKHVTAELLDATGRANAYVALVSRLLAEHEPGAVRSASTDRSRARPIVKTTKRLAPPTRDDQ